ncbi:MAG: hypothetical protein ACRDGA_08900, partial [Bacteroidota bacterium]
VLIYLLSNAVLYFLPERLFESLRLFSFLVLWDTLMLSFALVVTGQLGTDFYLTYFLIQREFPVRKDGGESKVQRLWDIMYE